LSHEKYIVSKTGLITYWALKSARFFSFFGRVTVGRLVL